LIVCKGQCVNVGSFAEFGIKTMYIHEDDVAMIKCFMG